MPLTDPETRFVAKARRGEPADFTACPAKPVIRADLLRAIVLGLPFEGVELGPIVAAQGTHLRHAFIEGPLRLADAGSRGNGLRSLTLEDCTIPSTLDLFSASLERLSLKGSWLGFVNLREAVIDGPFDFSDVAPALGRDCWIDARGATIAGNVTGSRCELRAPPKRDHIEPGDRRAALDAAGATIRGSLRLVHFTVHGGISLDAATISGDVWLQTGTMRQVEGDPLRAQNAQVSGIMVVRGCTVHGMVWLLGMRTGGILEISGGEVFGRVEENAASYARKAVIVSDADIGASLRFHNGFVAHGYVDCSTTRIRGDLNLRDARLLNYDAGGRGRALDATNAEIGANLQLDRSRVQGRLDIAGARIGGKLSLINARLTNCTPDCAGQAVEAVNISVGGNAEFGREDSGNLTEIEGVVDLTGAHVSGDVLFCQTRVANRNNTGSGEALRARRLRAGGSLVLGPQFTADGATLLTGSTLGRDLKCVKARLSNPARSALYAKDIEIGDDLKLQESTIEGDLRFERASVTGSVVWDDLRLEIGPIPPQFPPDYPARRVGRFELRHARIGSSLKCETLVFRAPFRLELTGAQIATIDLSSPDRWGTKRYEGFHCPLELDGLRYDRIEFPARIPGYRRDWELRARAKIRWLFGPPQGSVSDRLLDWVLRHGVGDRVQWLAAETVAVPAGTNPEGQRRRAQERRFLTVDVPPVAEHRFSPQPYRQLANVLRSQGYESEARNITMAEQWARPHRFWVRLLYWIYGAGFGFGLRPRRALITLAAYIGLGTIGTLVIMSRDMWLVETPLIAATTYTDEHGVRERGFIRAETMQRAVSELPCGYIRSWPQELTLSQLADTVADALLFTTDTVLPFIPLHLETKCEVSPAHPVLRLARGLYAVCGWIVTSLALLTLSGLVRRFETSAE